MQTRLYCLASTMVVMLTVLLTMGRQNTAATVSAGVALGDTTYLDMATLDTMAPVDSAVLDVASTKIVADRASNAFVVVDANGALLRTIRYDLDVALCNGVAVPKAVAFDARRNELYLLWLYFAGTKGNLSPSRSIVERVSINGADGVVVYRDSSIIFDLEYQTGRDKLLLMYKDWIQIVDRMGRPTADQRLISGGNRTQASSITATEDGTVATIKYTGVVHVIEPDGHLLAVLDLDGMGALALASSATDLTVLARDEASGRLYLRTYDWSGVSLGVIPLAEVATDGDRSIPLSLDQLNDQLCVTLVDGLGMILGGIQGTGDRVSILRLAGRDTFTMEDSQAGYSSCDDDGVTLSGYDSTRYAIVDRILKKLVIMDRAGTGRTYLALPEDDIGDLDVDAAGNMYYLDPTSIVKYSASTGAEAWREPCFCTGDSRISIAADRLYVGLPGRGQLLILNPSTGEQLHEVAAPAGDGTWPFDVAATDAGVYTTSPLAKRVELRGVDGSLLRAWSVGYSVGPGRIDVQQGPGGQTMLVASTLDGFLQRYDLSSDNLVAKWQPTVGRYRMRVSDVLLWADGTVLAADSWLRIVQKFHTQPDAVTPAALPSSTATPSVRSCIPSGDKTASPKVAVLGDPVQVTLGFRAQCPQSVATIGADIVLQIDTSGSMTDSSALAFAQAAARSFVTLIDLKLHRVAISTFGDESVTTTPLTSNRAQIMRGIEELHTGVAGGNTRVEVGLNGAADELRTNGRPDAVGVIVLMSDGYNSSRDEEALDRVIAAANSIRATGVDIFCVGVGLTVDHRFLTSLAGSASHYLYAPLPSDLVGVYVQLAHWISTSLAGDLVITDSVSDVVRLVDHSSTPEALTDERHLQWGRAIIPSGGLTMTYQVIPLATGRIPVGAQSRAQYVDVDGTAREYFYRVPYINVITATPSPTPSSTPTPDQSGRVYLPIAMREQCVLSLQRVDVAIVLDASTSMGESGGGAGSKLDAARAAIRAFVRLVNLREGDRIAIIAFNSDAYLLQSPTSDEAVIERALASITLSPMTRIHRGIEEAFFVLQDQEPSSTRSRAMIVLTDGRSNPEPASVAIRRADDAKRAGIIVFSIGIGSDLDAEALRLMASRTEYAFMSVSSTELVDIYGRIARAIPCDGRTFWGGR